LRPGDEYKGSRTARLPLDFFDSLIASWLMPGALIKNTGLLLLPENAAPLLEARAIDSVEKFHFSKA
jgi:hypothetical protein